MIREFLQAIWKKNKIFISSLIGIGVLWLFGILKRNLYSWIFRNVWFVLMIAFGFVAVSIAVKSIFNKNSSLWLRLVKTIFAIVLVILFLMNNLFAYIIMSGAYF